MADFKKIDDLLGSLKDQINKEYGKGSAVNLDSPNATSSIPYWVSSGSMVIDKALMAGRTGDNVSLIPFGRQMEIAGPPSSGKTSMCAMTAANVQKMGGLVIAVDTEERIDEVYWKALGVDTSRVLNLHAKTIEEVFDKQYMMIQNIAKAAPEIPVLMLWDSVGGTASGLIADENGKGTVMERAAKMMGREAKTLGNGVKVLNPLISKTKVCYLYTNHVYDNMSGYGPEHETPGGKKLKFYATVRLQLKRGAGIKEEDALGNTVTVGHHVHVETIKNSMGPSLMKKEAVIRDGVGFCNDFTVLESAKKMKWIDGKGWSTWTSPSGEEVKFQGWDGFKEKVVTHPEYPSLYQRVYDIL